MYQGLSDRQLLAPYFASTVYVIETLAQIVPNLRVPMIAFVAFFFNVESFRASSRSGALTW